MNNELPPNRRKLKRELYKVLKEPRTNITSQRIAQLCKALDAIPPQAVITNKKKKDDKV